MHRLRSHLQLSLTTRSEAAAELEFDAVPDAPGFTDEQPAISAANNSATP
jgi:hypothetical protein